MSAHDVVLSLIYQVPAAAFAIVGLLTLALPVFHLTLAVGRVLSGREANINWWVLGRALPLIVALIVAVPLILAAQSWTGQSQIAAGEVALIYLSAGMIFLPIALPLIQAYVQRLPRAGTFIYALLAVLSLPVAAALATQAAVATTRAIAQPSDTARPQAFIADTMISQCKADIFAVVPEGYVASIPSADAPPDVSYAPYFFFWMDMSFKAAFLDFFETFDCGVTNLRHNPDHVLMSSLVFIYRAFVSLIVLSVMALPFRRGRE
jgi:hypothetical protein